MDVEELFAKRPIADQLARLLRTMEYSIQAEYPRAKLLEDDIEMLISTFVQIAQVDVPTIDLDRITMFKPREEEVPKWAQIAGRPILVVSPLEFNEADAPEDSPPGDVSQTLYAIKVPFHGGTSNTFYLTPTTLVPVSPAVLTEEALTLGLYRNDPDPAMLRAEFDREVAAFKANLDCLRNDTTDHNASLRDRARRAIEAVRTKNAQDMAIVEAIGFPLSVRADSSLPQIVPPLRRRVPIALPAEQNELSEVVLRDPDYDFILDTITRMATVFERSPAAVAKMGEVDLRWILLVGLNAHFEGQATGETFNQNGHTDILIRVQNQNVFVGECKFWDGRVKLFETIDQLMGYVSWRDTKTAVIFFNRKKRTTRASAIIRSQIPNHPQFLRTLDTTHAAQFSYIFRHPTDSDKEFILTIMVFDVPAPEGIDIPEGVE